MHILFCDFGAAGVQINFLVGLDFDVYSRIAVFKIIKVAANIVVFEHFFKLFSGKASEKAECRVGNSELCEYDRHVDAFSAVIDFFAVRTVYVVGSESFELHHIVESRIQSNGVNH